MTSIHLFCSEASIRSLQLRFAICIIILLVAISSSAQEKKALGDSKHKIGFSIGVGRNNGLDFANINIDSDYEALFFQFQYHRTLIGRKLWGAELLGQPQINFGSFQRLKDFNQTTRSIELGINVGLLLRLNLFHDYFSIYSLIGSGPHFISRTPDRQANGFIFSDNFFLGANIRVSKDLFIDIRSGKRHASNLDFDFPNGGINTFIINFGIIKLL